MSIVDLVGRRHLELIGLPVMVHGDQFGWALSTVYYMMARRTTSWSVVPTTIDFWPALRSEPSPSSSWDTMFPTVT
nr:hypothetical protein I308_06126 [Cryptococcus tetragattii IND107]